MEKKYIAQIRNILAIFLIIVISVVCKLTGTVSLNIVFSLLLFLVILPLVNILEKRHIPYGLVTVIALFLIILIMSFATWLIFHSVEVLLVKLPDYTKRLNEIEEFFTAFLNRWISIPEDATLFEFFDVDWLSLLMPILKSVSNSVLIVLKNVFMIIIFVLFLLMERNTIVSKIIRATQKDNQNRTLSILRTSNKQVSIYISIKLAVSVVTGLLFYVIARIAKLDFADVWGIFTVIMNFIPTFGSIISTLAIVLMAIIQYLPSWYPVLFVAVSSVIVQFVIGNIIEPKIQGTQLNLSPFVILVALSLFGYIWGIAGMFLAVPLLSVVEIILFNLESTKGIATMMSSGNSFKNNT